MIIQREKRKTGWWFGGDVTGEYGKSAEARKYYYIYYTWTYSRHCGVGAHQRQGKRSEKSEKQKVIYVERAKPPTPTREIGALILEEE